MTAIFSKIISLLISVLMMILNLIGGTPIAPEPPELPEIPEGVTVSDPAVIAEYYNIAVAATNDDAPRGTMLMTLSKPIEGDGAIGTILKVLQPTVDSALKKNSKETSWIPGGREGDLLASDIKECAAISEDGKTTLIIHLKSQVDGPDCDGNTAGPVARGIGTIGSIDGALAELGATLTSGRETIKITYDNAYITCVVDEETGKIVSGEWGYTVDISIGEVRANLRGIVANLKNITAGINYKHTIG